MGYCDDKVKEIFRENLGIEKNINKDFTLRVSPKMVKETRQMQITRSQEQLSEAIVRRCSSK